MPQLTLAVGVLMILLGLISYLLSGEASLTALIPAVFGVIFIALGRTARKESARKNAMHLSVGLALVGFLGVAWRAFGPFAAMLSGGTVDRPAAVIIQIIMAFLCLVLLVFGIRSFVEARRKKTE